MHAARDKSNLRAATAGSIIAGVGLLLLLGVIVHGWLRYRDRHVAEFQWMRRAQYCLIDLQEALRCHEQRSGSWPAEVNDLFRSGYLFASTTFEPSRQGVHEPVGIGDQWMRLDQILLRKMPAGGLDDRAILAIVMPERRHERKYLLLQRDGQILFLAAEDWHAHSDDWRERIGGIDLWREP
jgi:hypothetical protein